MPTPHDALFKFVFSKPENAASELRALLPKKLASRIDWKTLAVVPGSFIETRLVEPPFWSMLCKLAMSLLRTFVGSLESSAPKPRRLT